MTVRELYENVLIEQNKVKSPALHLEDFIYFANKGIQEYKNERYALYETTQQLTDDLSALSRSVKYSISGTSAVISDTVTGSAIESLSVYLHTKYNSSAVTMKLPDYDWTFLKDITSNNRMNTIYLQGTQSGSIE